LKNTDKRIKNKQSITPGFLMAALLWPKLIQKCSKNNELNIRKFFRSMDGILRDQHQLTAIPRKFQSYIKDIWVLQLKLDSRLGKYPHKLVKHPRFRAAYDFLLIRESAANEDYQIGDWWTKFQKQNYDERETALTKLRNQRDNESDKKFGFLGELI
jgi:poly(A) polymerase